MNARDFVASADAMAAVIAVPGASVGRRILRAIQSTRAMVAFNTNLGIVLLCAPLAHAVVEASGECGLRARLQAVLAALDVDDAVLAYQAIRLAEPADWGGRSPRRRRCTQRDPARGNARSARAGSHCSPVRDRFPGCIRYRLACGAQSAGALGSPSGLQWPCIWSSLRTFPTVTSRASTAGRSRPQ